ncbi:cellobiose dehydrogenase [Verticillium alfalfae VaMs.102]|uniref:Cellobiose dehydrogenase n=1 Tax=Verticillium alfalfae (strain VaMs.102 / ATCC MYA-4576 / FGSC 10136) TaxID=526221 RepID=C9SY67_VERA1|nr:cellobiose dehydrogenase [Verticillium alfalfae VaMs.102]EEY23732.1 cellobiose dehydrogenase [Verticillium alfalfae VaMs.102]
MAEEINVHLVQTVSCSSTCPDLPVLQLLPNLSLQTNVKVLRAVREGSAVTGVEIELTPSTRQVIELKTGGAVILAAGAFLTPRLLFNSGIGPKAQIETVASGTTHINLPPQNQWIPLPVGESMRDHPIFTVNFNVSTGLKTLPQDDWLTPSQETIDLFAKGSGLLSQSGQRLDFWTGVNSTDGIVRYVQGTVNAPSDNIVSMKVYLTHGLTSVGALDINHAGATTIITQPSMITDGDREAMLSFMTTLIEYASKFNSSLTLPVNTTAESLTQTFRSGSHFVGTAVMGEEDDGSRVVDTDARVWGTDNLYVVDASIHPKLPTGNTQAPVMVVGEHAVSKILGVKPIKCKTKRSHMFRDRREVLSRSYLHRKASIHH